MFTFILNWLTKSEIVQETPVQNWVWVLLLICYLVMLVFFLSIFFDGLING